MLKKKEFYFIIMVMVFLNPQPMGKFGCLIEYVIFKYIIVANKNYNPFLKCIKKAIYFLKYFQTYTQYIPLSIYDLQTWMGAPSIYVYDCSNAGIIVESFKTFADQHKSEYEVKTKYYRLSVFDILNIVAITSQFSTITF